MRNLEIIVVYLINQNTAPMKRFAIIIILLAGIGLQAQELSFGYSHTFAFSTQFKHPVGLYVGYTKSVSQKVKINADLLSNYSFQWYHNIVKLDAEPGTYLAYNIKPNNLWLSLSASATFRTFSKNGFNIYIGPQVSLNYFFCDEKLKNLTGIHETTTIQEKENFLNKVGIGCNFEFELKELLGKRLSVVASFTPQIITYDFYEMGGNTDWFILANVSRVGLRYNIK